MFRLSLVYLVVILTLNFGLSQSIHGDKLKIDCIDCHSTKSWKINPGNNKFDHSATNFNLTGQHRLLDCQNCHRALKFEAQDKECTSCHIDIHTSNNDQECQFCHTTNSWLITNGVEIHQFTRFPLVGPHVNADCDDCHTDATIIGFPPLDVDCFSCHSKDYLSTQEPDHIKYHITQDCEECHSLHSPNWDLGFMQHDIFPLKGGHAFVDCSSCHIEGILQNIGQDCYSCHQADYNLVSEPNHVTNQFPLECEECHTINPGWTPTTFDHNSVYPLTGGHTLVKNECAKCHLIDYFSTGSDCIDCHLENYNSTIDPNHIQNQFSTSCEECHTTNPGWTPTIFDHNSVYPLTGGHEVIQNECITCHSDGYSNTSSECVSCHLTDYNSALDPNHIQNQFSTTCEECHTTNPGWNPVTFDHNIVFPLLGGHELIKTECSKCHISGYTNTTNECVGCHLTDYNSTVDPNHQSLSFSTNCEECHTTNPGWSPTSFDHNSIYPLLGGHELIKTECSKCHISGYASTNSECISCHLADYNTTVDPNHQSLNFSTDCEQCHTTNPGWSPVTFDHNIVYPLLGAHELVKTECTICHSNGYSNTSNECVSCHLTDYNSAADPNHVNNSFPQNCELCHTANPDWTPSIFDHNSVYPLTGGHNTVKNECALCHSSGYNNTSTTCSICHLNDYNNTSDPNHKNNNFPQGCEQCHTTNPGWSPSIFDHNTVYPLTGGHNTVKNNCALCHSSGYTNTSTVCSSCHLSDYNSTNNPNHVNLNFPKNCDECHTTNPGWSPATFDHDGIYFPIYSGKHQGEWNNCSDCHTNTSNYSVFTCIECHEHNNKNEVDNDHKDVNGYQYTATSCYNCHPTGRAED